MSNRIWNFNAGPATLPIEVLEKAKYDIPDYRGSGMAVMELSHRGKDYADIHAEAQSLLHELFNIPGGYKTLFLQGGASLQFAMIPMNLLTAGNSADYIITGAWSKKALKEAQIVGNPQVAGSSEDAKFNKIPGQDELKLNPSAVYVHLTSNNTIAGTQWATYPETGEVPIIADMSSDILSRPVDVKKFGLIYAGAQKNLGPAGVTIVILKNELLSRCRDDLPTLLKYSTHVEKDSLFNTAPTYTIYLVKLVLEWLKEKGGVEAIEKINQAKGELLYGLIDEQSDFYRGPVAVHSRSLMNVTFRLPTEELEKQFISEGIEQGFGGLKGHRSVGGVRVSMYNALPLKGIEELTNFMKVFSARNG